MNRTILVVILAFSMSLVAGQPASATPLGTNITIPDGSAVAGYHGIGQAGEDNETEGNPPTYQTQAWDLEGMFLKGNSLSMVGGFKFDTGVYEGKWYRSGDIFIDVLNSALLWDYAIRMSFDLVHHTQTYDVYALNGGTTFVNPTDVPSSTPWMVNAGYSVLQHAVPFSFGETSTSGFSGWQAVNPGPDGDPYWELAPDKHYTVSGFDLGFIGPGHETDFTAHFTMECGNDLLVGQAATVPEPATLLMLGFGLAGLGLRVYRKQRE